jgi:hypothetical protein
MLAFLAATPAMAHPHYGSDYHISYIAILAYVFAGLAFVMAVFWGGILSRWIAVVALAGPILWGLFMVMSGHGTWSYEHYVAHHNTASYLGFCLALIVFGMIDWRLASNHATP